MADLSLKWEKFGLNLGLHDLLTHRELVDVTIACQGEYLQAHKTVLAACSQQFRQMFLLNPCQHPVIFMQDMKLSHLKALLNFMYTGETTVNQRELPGFMQSADALQVSGLSNCNTQNQEEWEAPSSSKKRKLDEQTTNAIEILESLNLLSPPVPVDASSSSSEAVPRHHEEPSKEIPTPAKKPVEVIKLEDDEHDGQLYPGPRPSSTPQTTTNVQQATPQSSNRFEFELINDRNPNLQIPQQRMCALLDGTFFKIVKDTSEGIWAKCQLCIPRHKVIKGSWETTSNFKTHISRVHNDKLKAYEEHKQTWRFGGKRIRSIEELQLLQDSPSSSNSKS